jgi:hypothetical protein
LKKIKVKGQDIKVIAQTVDVCEEFWADWLLGMECQNSPFRSATNCTANMGKCSCTTTAWQREASPGRKAFGCTVDALLKAGYIIWCDDARRLVRRVGFCGKLSAYHEEIVLDGNETFPIGIFLDVCQQEADLGIQFVDGAVAFKAGTGFIHSFTAYKRSGSGITGFSINLRHLLFTIYNLQSYVIYDLTISSCITYSYFGTQAAKPESNL